MNSDPCISTDCILCHETGGELIWRNASIRVVSVTDSELPGYTRVIWEDHVREMSDLSAAGRLTLMRTVFHVERAQRMVLQPDKVNLAELGNQTPHLHWHILPRWKGDPWFPDSIWAPRKAHDARSAQAWEHRRLWVKKLNDEYFSVLCRLLD